MLAIIRLFYWYLKNKVSLFGRVGNTYVLAASICELALYISSHYPSIFTRNVVNPITMYLFTIMMSLSVISELWQRHRTSLKVFLYVCTFGLLYLIFNPFYVCAVNTSLVILGLLVIGVRQKSNKNVMGFLFVFTISLDLYLTLVCDILRLHNDVQWQSTQQLQIFGCVCFLLSVANMVFIHLSAKRWNSRCWFGCLMGVVFGGIFDIYLNRWNSIVTDYLESIYS